MNDRLDVYWVTDGGNNSPKMKLLSLYCSRSQSGLFFCLITVNGYLNVTFRNYFIETQYLYGFTFHKTCIMILEYLDITLFYG